MGDRLQNLDWVTARSACSLRGVFEGLKTEIKGDVKTRNELRPSGAGYQFGVTARGDEIRVYSESNQGSKSVVFTLSDKFISAKDGEGAAIFQATVTLNHEGRCVARIDGTECEFWQMRQRALEKLLFETFVGS